MLCALVKCHTVGRTRSKVFSLPLNQDVLARWRGRLPTVLEVALVLALALQVASLLWLALTPTGPIGAQEASAERPAALASFGRSDVFFRQTTVDSATASGAEALGYTLFGVRTGIDNAGAAILAHDSDPHAAYRVGDVIAPGLVLDAVGIDHVVLRSAGKRHRIDMPKLMSTGAPAAAAATGALASSGLPSSPAGPPAIDPQQLLTQTGLRARAEGGYTVIPRGDGAVLRQAGLQPGDVLLSVNGQSLTPERLGELNKELKGQSQVAITFERDGTTRSVTLPTSPP